MEKRRFKRINCKLNAEVTLNGKSYNVVVENLSEKGLYKTVVIEEELTDIVPGATLEVNLRLPSGKKINLPCNIVWVRIDTKPPGGSKFNMGLEIISPPLEYIEFVRTL
jgi:hypothetical protein